MMPLKLISEVNSPEYDKVCTSVVIDGLQYSKRFPIYIYITYVFKFY